MQKVAINFFQLILLLTITLFIATGCRLFQPTAYFFIINESTNQKLVDISLTLDGKTVFNDTIKYINVRPDLQYTPKLTLSKGNYIITVEADNGKVKVTKPIILDSDRYIFVTYLYEAPIDSSSSLKKYGFFYSDKMRGRGPEIGVYITDKEPIHL